MNASDSGKVFKPNKPPALHERQADELDRPGCCGFAVSRFQWCSTALGPACGLAVSVPDGAGRNCRQPASSGPQILKRQRRVWLVSEKFFNPGIFNAWVLNEDYL